MEAKRKLYEAPSLRVVKVAYEVIVCASPQTWFLDSGTLSSSQELGRDGYGNAELF